jgi:hypothetical protein
MASISAVRSTVVAGAGGTVVGARVVDVVVVAAVVVAAGAMVSGAVAGVELLAVQAPRNRAEATIDRSSRLRIVFLTLRERRRASRGSTRMVFPYRG